MLEVTSDNEFRVTSDKISTVDGFDFDLQDMMEVDKIQVDALRTTGSSDDNSKCVINKNCVKTLDAKYDEKPKTGSPSNQCDKDVNMLEQMNHSIGESTGLVLTKALKTLVSHDYDVVTPPRQCTKVIETTKKEKKVSLFRPYELDNGKSSDNKIVSVTQSPMLLRSNYSNSGQEWLIEKRNKSEAISTNYTNYAEIPSKSNPQIVTKNKTDKTSDNKKCPKDVKVSCDNSIDQKYSAVSVAQTLRLPVTCTLSVPLPLRSSTPKSSPCPSPNMAPFLLKSNQGQQLMSPVAQTLQTSLPTPIKSSDSYQSKSENEACIDKDTKNALKSEKSFPENCQSGPEVPSYVRYNAQTGHRLPLKHSYKHQRPVIETPERSRTHIKTEPVNDAPDSDRYRSNSCPPLTKHRSMTSNQNDVEGENISQQHGGIFSNASKTYIDAIKEKWAMHIGVMSSSTQSEINKTSTLPSFSTFSDKLNPTQRASRVPSGCQNDKTCIMVNNQVQNNVRSKSSDLRHAPSLLLNQRSEEMASHGAGIVQSNGPNLSTNFVSTNVPVTKVKTWHVPHETSMKLPVSIESRTTESSQVSNVGFTRPVTCSSSSQHSDKPQISNFGYNQQMSLSSQKLHTLPSRQHSVVKDSTSIGLPKTVLPELHNKFKSPFNIYSDPQHFPIPVLDPKLPKLGMFLPPSGGLNHRHFVPHTSMNPSLLHPIKLPTYIPSSISPSVHARATPDVTTERPASQPASSSMLKKDNEDVDIIHAKQSEHLTPTMIETRRPLGTSAMQNQLPSLQPDPNVPIGALMVMMKTEVPNVEVINGGYGIKNPTFTAPKVQDFPEQCVAPDSSKFVCKFCKKEFALQRLLNRHLKCHSDSKRYLCTFCGKGFNDTFDLKRHTRIHTGVKPYKCPSCDKAFTQRCSLESHTKKVHGMDLPYGYKERRTKVYVCEDCGHSTSDPEVHFRHLQQNHPFCPALQRCHDKRQFKFKMENGEEVSESDAKQASYRSVMDVETSANEVLPVKCHVPDSSDQSEEILNIRQMDDSQIEQTNVSRLQAVSDLVTHNNDSTNDSVVKNLQSNLKQVVTNDRISGFSGISSEQNKRLSNSEPPNVSPKKKFKPSNSPKKNRPNSSPSKIRPATSMCENGGLIPRYNAENIIGKKLDDVSFKKRPLGSLTQNTLNQQKNALNILPDQHNVVSKRPLGNILGHTQGMW
ncbi:zinc finger protein [Mactra antiquata]